MQRHYPYSFPEESVREIILIYQKLTPVLIELALKDIDIRVRSALANRRDLPGRFILQLARDPSVDVRLTLAKNEKITEEIYEILSKNPDERIRAAFL
ncbi:MAG: hypothetical protein GYA24_06575 [Candidatus Lokiarchaeota archaeon]|nr:hypothetical protein [Candidatus Lokiarchaeota archaeon]